MIIHSSDPTFYQIACSDYYCYRMFFQGGDGAVWTNNKVCDTWFSEKEVLFHWTLWIRSCGSFQRPLIWTKWTLKQTRLKVFEAYYVSCLIFTFLLLDVDIVDTLELVGRFRRFIKKDEEARSVVWLSWPVFFLFVYPVLSINIHDLAGIGANHCGTWQLGVLAAVWVSKQSSYGIVSTSMLLVLLILFLGRGLVWEVWRWYCGGCWFSFFLFFEILRLYFIDSSSTCRVIIWQDELRELAGAFSCKVFCSFFLMYLYVSSLYFCAAHLFMLTFPV